MNASVAAVKGVGPASVKGEAEGLLRDGMEVKEALGLLATGKVSMGEYMAWDQRRIDAARAGRAGGGGGKKIRVTVSEKGMITLNGVRLKGEGFAPNFLPHEVADLCEHIHELAAAVVECADKVVAVDAVVADVDAGGRPTGGELPHERRGKAMLRWEGIVPKSGPTAGKPTRDGGARADVVARCRRFLELIGKAKAGAGEGK